MSLDLYLYERTPCPHCGVLIKGEIAWSTNITHNLGAMFDAAGVYQILWHGDGLIAGEVLPQLAAALDLMISDPQRFEAYNAKNGWGLYCHAVPWLKGVVEACRDWPLAELRCST